MKKSLIALAAMAVVGSAFAQSSVTIFGTVDVGYGGRTWKDNDLGANIEAKTMGAIDGSNIPNRIGFRGVEDLGGGLKAEFLIEHGLSVTSQTLTNFRTSTSGFQIDNLASTGAAAEGGRSATSINRQSWVGLSGNFGSLRAGYLSSNFYQHSSQGPFLVGAGGMSEGQSGSDFAHTTGLNYVGGSRGNGLQYTTPRFGGFYAQFQYLAADLQNSYDSDLNGVRKQQRPSLLLRYEQGPLALGLVYTQYRTETQQATYAAALGTGQFVPTSTSATALGQAAATAKVWQLGAAYDFGVARVAGTYNMGDNGSPCALVAGTTVSGATTYSKNCNEGPTDVKYNGWQLGVRVPVGAVSLFAAYGQAVVKAEEASSLTTPAFAAGAKFNDVKQWQIGAQYDLSKRTAAYFYFGETKDDGIGNYSLRSTTAPASLTGTTALSTSGYTMSWDKKTNWVVGVRHSF